MINQKFLEIMAYIDDIDMSKLQENFTDNEPLISIQYESIVKDIESAYKQQDISDTQVCQLLEHLDAHTDYICLKNCKELSWDEFEQLEGWEEECIELGDDYESI